MQLRVSVCVWVFVQSTYMKRSLSGNNKCPIKRNIKAFFVAWWREIVDNHARPTIPPSLRYVIFVFFSSLSLPSKTFETIRCSVMSCDLVLKHTRPRTSTLMIFPILVHVIECVSSSASLCRQVFFKFWLEGGKKRKSSTDSWSVAEAFQSSHTHVFSLYGWMSWVLTLCVCVCALAGEGARVKSFELLRPLKQIKHLKNLLLFEFIFAPFSNLVLPFLLGDRQSKQKRKQLKRF